MGSRWRPILIAGPTASGKSALAVRLAERFGGVVVNADAMQCYRDLRIITARPSPEEEARVPHLLYGTVDGGSAHSVERWLGDLRIVLERLAAEDRLPIVVGGSGLYFKALTQGLSAIPTVPEDVRADVRAWAADKPPRAIHEALAAIDPVSAARLRPTDPQRLVRALEVVRAFGTSLTTYQASREPPLVPLGGALAYTTLVDRAAIWRRIDTRFDRMMEDGALEEVAALHRRALDRTLPLMRSLGVPPLLEHLDGAMPLADAVAAGKLASRRYVKRQDTFARTQLNFRPVQTDQAEAIILEDVQSA